MLSDSPHLARLAVNGGDIVLVATQPAVDVLTERPEEFDARRVVVVKCKLRDVIVELALVVRTLRATASSNNHGSITTGQ